MRGFLSQAGVPFTVRDIDEDPSAYDALIALGIRAVPLTMIGEARIRGFDAAALRQALEQAGAAGSGGA